MTQRSAYEIDAPEGVKALGGVYIYVAHSGLPKTLLDLVYLRSSQINGCAYCIDSHSHDLLKEGVSLEKLALVSVWREADPYFSERERAALAWTESLTRLPETAAPDEAYTPLAGHFSEKEIVDLTVLIGMINLWNRIGVGFRLPLPATKP